jgi:hypothetical protein
VSARPLVAPVIVGWLWGCASALGPSLSRLELEQWLEIRTGHFAIATNASQTEGERLAQQLLRFIAVVQRVTGLQDVKPRLPVRVFLFRTYEQLARFPVVPYAQGYHTTTLREHLIGLSAEAPELSNPVLYHEYTHFLLHNARTGAYPAWY